MSSPAPAAIAELVRLPAVLSAPGDTLLGVASSGRRAAPARTAALVASSSCMYMAGMALNDYAHRDVDAPERPHPPIPSRRVSPRFALRPAGPPTAASGVAALLARDFLRLLHPAEFPQRRVTRVLRRQSGGNVFLDTLLQMQPHLLGHVGVDRRPQGRRGGPAHDTTVAGRAVGAQAAAVTAPPREHDEGGRPGRREQHTRGLRCCRHRRR